MSRRVLLVVTSHEQLGTTGRKTGLYLPELAQPHAKFQKAGLRIDVASPLGGEAPIDPRSLNSSFAAAAHLAAGTLPLSAIEPSDYDAYLLVGGHGIMFDGPGNRELQRLLPVALASGRVVAAVCHGPAGLVGLTDLDGLPLVSSRRLTAFSDAEEVQAGMTAVMPFALESRLRELGARLELVPPFQANVVIDGTLITGQNPASASGVAEAVIEILVERGEP